MEKTIRFSLWYFILALLIMILLQRFFFMPHVQDITYSELRKLVQEKKVNDLVISSDTIRGKLEKGAADIIAASREDQSAKELLKTLEEEGHAFSTVRMEDPDLVDVLQNNDIEYKAQIEQTWFTTLLSWLVPILLFFAIWGYLLKRMQAGMGGGLMSIGKSKARVYVEDETKVTFRDVAGVEEAEEELKEVIEFLKNPERFQTLGGKIPKGVLLVGPPGTGKTLLAKAVAGEARVPFFSLVGSDFVEMFVGVGAARVRDLFAQAQQKAPCIIFIDELDALGRARGIGPVMGGHDEREQTLNQLLSEMDGFDTRKGVIIMAATNRPEVLDPALLRPGRFDRHVLVDKPDIRGREQIFEVHSRGVKLGPGVDLKTLAARTPGMVGADIANIVNEAALLAARKNKKAVEMDDFDEAIDRITAGLERKSRVMNKKEKEIVAYHETGHALIAESLGTTDHVHKISIVPRGISALGYTLQLPTEDRYLMTKPELLDKVAVLLGGRAAEEVRFGEISTGAHNDLFRATDIARSMVKEYGMSEKLGPLTFEKERRPLFLETGMSSGKEYSEDTAMEIDREVAQIVRERYETVKGILEEKKDKLEKVATILQEKEVIEGEELRELID
ncbi:MAG TPA: ATP-dependent zinc metalloprotease FtsH [Thermodesulfobacteriota bacterium]|nr:ATP-dependent zinc metalloprotease FtsH [Thermodesulfobacteriota bacterium]